jgi:hypothetical protein
LLLPAGLRLESVLRFLFNFSISYFIPCRNPFDHHHSSYHHPLSFCLFLILPSSIRKILKKLCSEDALSLRLG